MASPSPPLLTIDDQIAGRVEPDLDSFSIQGLDEVWMLVPKRFVITAAAKGLPDRPLGDPLLGKSPDRPLGGAWAARVAFNIEGSASTSVEVVRMGPDSAYFDFTFSLQGLWKIWLDVSSVPVKGSPFIVNVHWGSASQISKWKTVEEFLTSADDDAVTAVTIASLGYSEIQFSEAAAGNSYQALSYRAHVLRFCESLPPEKSLAIRTRILRSVLVRRTGAILDDFPDIQAIFVSHNSWMEWPKESGYQSKLLARLSEKDRKSLLDRSVAFSRTRLTYGSTMLFSAANVAPPGRPIEPKCLINTVTVVFKAKDKVTKAGYKHTKPEDLKHALNLSFLEAERKGITSIVVPSNISKNYFAGGKNDEIIYTGIKEWIARNPNTTIQTIVIAQKDPTPKVPRKKRFGSLHRRASGGSGSGGLPIPDFK